MESSINSYLLIYTGTFRDLKKGPFLLHYFSRLHPSFDFCCCRLGLHGTVTSGILPLESVVPRIRDSLDNPRIPEIFSL